MRFRQRQKATVVPRPKMFPRTAREPPELQPISTPNADSGRFARVVGTAIRGKRWSQGYQSARLAVGRLSATPQGSIRVTIRGDVSVSGGV